MVSNDQCVNTRHVYGGYTNMLPSLLKLAKTPVNAHMQTNKGNAKSWWQRPSCLAAGMSAPSRFWCFFELAHPERQAVRLRMTHHHTGRVAE